MPYQCKKTDSGDGELLIYDEIGASYFGGITAAQVIKDLKALGGVGRIVTRINSPGGDVFEAYAIYNALVGHAAKVRVQIEGAALSAASLIAMAGNEIAMAETSWMMIHDPWTIAWGNAGQLREMADQLDAQAGTIRKVYTDRTGNPDAKVKEWMAEETWFDSADAIKNGFATEQIANLKVAAMYDPARHHYRNTPQSLATPNEVVAARMRRARIAAMARKAKEIGIKT